MTLALAALPAALSAATSMAPAADPEANLLAARWLMACSLGLHIVLSCLGVALPALIWLAHRRGLAHDDGDALRLARRWGKAAAVLFAIGAVSGTVLSFELGLLWPGLMGTFGDVIGVPFALEGVFFFLEAIFLGVYLYGWRGLPARLHLWTLVPITLSGVLGTFCVLAVNGWMNRPAGFDLEHYVATGVVRDVDPWAAMLNPAVWSQFAHMLPATYVVTGFLVASVHAVGVLRGRGDRLQVLGARIGVTVAALALPLQVLTGDLAARHVAAEQPVKFAALELLPHTVDGAPLTLGGVLVDGELVGGVELPGVTSLLIHGDPTARVAGLDAVPADERPPANVVHVAFQLMVGLGTGMLGLGLLTGWVRWRRRRWPEARAWWWAVALAGPASVLALEAGWVTTEVGRQPWIAQGVMRVSEAVTPRTGIGGLLVGLLALYGAMVVATAVVFRHMSAGWRRGEDPPAPYGPTGGGDPGSDAPASGEAPR